MNQLTRREDRPGAVEERSKNVAVLCQGCRGRRVEVVRHEQECGTRQRLTITGDPFSCRRPAAQVRPVCGLCAAVWLLCWTWGVIVAAAPGSGSARVLRAATLATVAVVLGTSAHAAAGGCLELVAIAGALVVMAPASWILVCREVSGPVLAGWLALGQVFVHLLLHAACAGEGAEPRQAVLMPAVHVAAVAGSAVALRAGEAGLWAARRLQVTVTRLRRWLALTDCVALPPSGPASPAAVGALAVPSAARDVLSGWRERRGPPRGLLAR